MKNKVALKNTNSVPMKEMVNLVKDAFKGVTAENCRAAVEHCKKIEGEYRGLQILMDSEVRPILISTLNDSESEEIEIDVPTQPVAHEDAAELSAIREMLDVSDAIYRKGKQRKTDGCHCTKKGLCRNNRCPCYKRKVACDSCDCADGCTNKQRPVAKPREKGSDEDDELTVSIKHSPSRQPSKVRIRFCKIVLSLTLTLFVLFSTNLSNAYRI